MPLEGHWNRVNTPLRQLTGRERRIVAFAAALFVAIAIAVVVVAASATTAPTPAGCIDAIVPGAMGGQPVRGCGAAARSICAAHRGQTDPGSRAIEAACRRAGLPAAG